jgi:hypothetical protein
MGWKEYRALQAYEDEREAAFRARCQRETDDEAITQFDPWDWLGVHCGGYFEKLDLEIICFLVRLNQSPVPPSCDPNFKGTPGQLLCATLLCNTDAFEFEGDPTNLRFVGDERFSTLQELIDAWSAWAQKRYG